MKQSWFMENGESGCGRTRGRRTTRSFNNRDCRCFAAAGGRMVGWWKTLVGDLYEHVTIWEYDDMAAFEKAIGFLSKNADFAKFVTARDPLLAGEESRFLRLATSWAKRPSLA